MLYGEDKKVVIGLPALSLPTNGFECLQHQRIYQERFENEAFKKVIRTVHDEIAHQSTDINVKK